MLYHNIKNINEDRKIKKMTETREKEHIVEHIVENLETEISEVKKKCKEKQQSSMEKRSEGEKDFKGKRE